jgi:hypothetical protein
MKPSKDKRTVKTAALVLGTAAGAGLIYWIATEILPKKKVGDKLDTATKVNVHSIKADGVTLRIDAILKNPTEGELTIKQPYIKLLFGNKDLGNSKIENKLVTIAPYAETPMDPIYFTIPLMGLLTLGSGLLKALKDKKGAVITAVIMSGIKLGKTFHSYTKQQTFHLKPKI